MTTVVAGQSSGRGSRTGLTGTTVRVGAAPGGSGPMSRSTRRRAARSPSRAPAASARKVRGFRAGTSGSGRPAAGKSRVGVSVGTISARTHGRPRRAAIAPAVRIFGWVSSTSGAAASAAATAVRSMAASIGPIVVR